MIKNIVNLIRFHKWTDCEHGTWPRDWQPSSEYVLPNLIDWTCRLCGVQSSGVPKGVERNV